MSRSVLMRVMARELSQAGFSVVVLLLESRLLEVYGELQREGDVQHVIARQLTNLSWLLGDLQVQSRNFH